jgi:small basic protein
VRSVPWQAWILALCAAYVALAITLAPSEYGATLRMYLGFLLLYGPVIVAVGLVAVPLVERPRAPLGLLRDILRARGAPALVIIVVATLTGAAFTALKHKIPEYVPFFADRALADIDRAIHFVDPWVVAHHVLPESLSGVLGFLYGPYWFVQWIGVIVLMAFSRNTSLRATYLSAFTLSFAALSTVGRTAMNSAGPIFYDRLLGGSRFAPLMQVLADDRGGRSALSIADYLWTSYQDQTAVFGGGISAMPSLHVAVAFLNALLASRVHPALGILGWSYAVVVMFGSVYLGWHYAVDGYLSIVVVLVVWRLTERWLGPIRRCVSADGVGADPLA